jgi:CheY-like chemotaxis protein
MMAKRGNVPTPSAAERATPPIHVLLVEDNPADVVLTKIAFADTNEAVLLHVARDGVSAMDFLLQKADYADAPRPAIVLLDLNLPRMDGREVLNQMKAQGRLRSIPTIVLSMSDREADVQTSYDLHANAFMRKPLEFDAFARLIGSVNDFWLTEAILPLAT